MQNEQNQKQAKKIYTKPELRRIELAAEEVLSVGCKMISGSTGFGNPGVSCTAPSQCFLNGS